MDFNDVLAQSRALAMRQELELQEQQQYNQKVTGGLSSSSSAVPRIPKLERDLAQIDMESRRMVHKADDMSAMRGMGSMARPAGTMPGAGFGGAVPQPSASMAQAATMGRQRFAGHDASRLLSEYGVESSRLERSLQSITLLDTYEPLYPFSDTDLDSFIRQQNELTILSAIDTARMVTESESKQTRTAALEARWNATKRDLLSQTAFVPLVSSEARGKVGNVSEREGAAVSLKPGLRSAASSDMTTGSSIAVSPGRSQAHSEYARAVNDFVVRFRASSSSAVSKTGVAQSFELIAARNRRGQQVEACFHALRYICGEEHDDWYGENENVSNSDLSTAKMIASAKRCLEIMFRDGRLRAIVESNAVVARRGGSPGLLADVRAYLNVLLQRGVPSYLRGDGSPFLNSLPLWPQIYLCLRCGDLIAANQIVEEARQSLDNIGSSFARFFTAYVRSGTSRSVGHEMLAQLQQEFSLQVAESPDPYRRACYVLVTRMNPSNERIMLRDQDYALLFDHVEDYLWLQLSVVRLPQIDPELPPYLSSYTKTIDDVRKECLNFGPRHFDARGDKPFLYAFVLLVVGCFEEAIRYLLEHTSTISSDSLVDSFHIAFVLYFHKKLDPALYIDMLWRYIRPWIASEPEEAAIYALSLRDDEVYEKQQILKRIILQSVRITELLGDGKTGSRGTLGQLLAVVPLQRSTVTKTDGITTLVLDAAREAEDNGDRVLASKLYDIANCNSQVMKILVQRMGLELTNKGSPQRAAVLDEARKYARRLELEGESTGGREQRLVSSFWILLQLYDFFDLLWNSKLEEAWALFKRLDLLPNSTEYMLVKASELRAGGLAYDDALADRVPDTLVAVMELLYSLHSKVKRSEAIADARGDRATAAELRAEKHEYELAAQRLVSLFGMLQYPFLEISSKLVQLQVMMT